MVWRKKNVQEGKKKKKKRVTFADPIATELKAPKPVIKDDSIQLIRVDAKEEGAPQEQGVITKQTHGEENNIINDTTTVQPSLKEEHVGGKLGAPMNTDDMAMVQSTLKVAMTMAEEDSGVGDLEVAMHETEGEVMETPTFQDEGAQSTLKVAMTMAVEDSGHGDLEMAMDETEREVLKTPMVEDEEVQQALEATIKIMHQQLAVPHINMRPVNKGKMDAIQTLIEEERKKHKNSVGKMMQVGLEA